MFEWNEQQSKALKTIEAWIKDRKRKQIFRLYGYAGVGKTTLAKYIAASINGKVLYAAYTGKAALVMRKAGCNGATTIHSLIYIPKPQSDGSVKFILNKASPLKSADLLIVDECSMVDSKLGKDLLSFGVPILVLGDPMQLPPPSGTGFFISNKPDVMLTQIQRQAEDNPIIYLASKVREKNNLKLGTYGESIIKSTLSRQDLINHDQILVGRNITREKINRDIRKVLGYNSVMPEENDKLVCLKNDNGLGLFNGQLLTVSRVLEDTRNKKFHRYFLKDEDLNQDFKATIHDSFFNPDVEEINPLFLKGTQEMAYGYCLTTHKSQGSQWDTVLTIDESYCFRDDKWKWLYTAITRSSEKITLVTN